MTPASTADGRSLPVRRTTTRQRFSEQIADTLRPYAEAAVLTSVPAVALGLVLRSPSVVTLGLGTLATVGVAYPRTLRRVIIRTIRRAVKPLSLLAKAAVVVLAATVLGGGGILFIRSEGQFFPMVAGASTAVLGGFLVRQSVKVFRPKPRPRPKPIPVPLPVVTPAPPKPQPEAQAAPPLEPPKPPPKPKPRATVLLGGREFPADETDERNYALIGPPGSAKTTLLKLLLLPIIREVLEPGSDSRLVAFDPKREMYAWIASMWPQKTTVPLRYFCFNDNRTNIPDFDYDYRSLSDATTLSYAFFPENPNEHQPFFPESLRTLVATAAFAVKRRLGFWDMRLLVLVLSNPGYLRRLIGADACTRFAAELLSTRSEETAQNVQMTISSKLLRFRLLAAHFSRIRRGDTFSLDRFLEKPGVLVISRDRKYHVQHDGMNAVIVERLGQLLEHLQRDPTRARKTYIVLDEFPSLAGDKPCPGITDMFLRLRSLGVVFIIAFQTYATMKAVYGPKVDELINTCRNFLILGSGDTADAEHSAKLIGKIRGYEAQRNSSATESTNEGETTGTSDTTGENVSRTRLAGYSGNPWTFHPTNTRGTSSSRSDSRSRTTGRSSSMTEGVTWVWYDRDITSPTDLLRWPLPTDGIKGIAYRAGEPSAWYFAYGWDFINSQLHETNRFIEERIDRPDHEEILEELTPEELHALGLADAPPEDPALWPTPEEAGRIRAADWDGEDPSAEDEDEDDDSWLDT